MKWERINIAIGLLLAATGGVSLYWHQNHTAYTNGDFVLFWILAIGGVLLAVMSLLFPGANGNEK